jgi:hypothetical protein
LKLILFFSGLFSQLIHSVLKLLVLLAELLGRPQGVFQLLTNRRVFSFEIFGHLIFELNYFLSTFVHIAACQHEISYIFFSYGPKSNALLLVSVQFNGHGLELGQFNIPFVLFDLLIFAVDLLPHIRVGPFQTQN